MPSLAEVMYLLYILKRGKCLKVMSLPPTAPNVFLHILQVHHAIILDHILLIYHAVVIDKAADEKSPPHLGFGKFGWDIIGGFPIPANANQLTEPPELIQIIACNCIATGKACSTTSTVVIVWEFHAQFNVY